MKNNSDFLIHVLSALLIAGGIIGICGIGLNMWSGYMELKQQSTYVFFELAISVVVYVWSTLTGVDLWRGQTRGYAWAKILFAAQIPVIFTAVINYASYIGFGLDLVFGNVNSHLQIHMGSGFTLLVDPSKKSQIYGVNLVALIALVFLVSKARRASVLSSTR